MRNVLEIGFGGNPLGINYWHDKSIRNDYLTMEEKIHLFLDSIPSDVKYHGIDLPARLSPEEAGSYPEWCGLRISAIGLFMQEFKRLQKLKETKNIQIKEMDARNLDYPSSVFDEVHMHFVVTDPSVPEVDSIRMLSEAGRVLKPQGYLIMVGEKYTYDRSTGESFDEEERTLDLLAAAGLEEREVELDQATIFHKQIMVFYKIMKGARDLSYFFDPDAYLLVAGKS